MRAHIERAHIERAAFDRAAEERFRTGTADVQRLAIVDRRVDLRDERRAVVDRFDFASHQKRSSSENGSLP